MSNDEARKKRQVQTADMSNDELEFDSGGRLQNLLATNMLEPD